MQGIGIDFEEVAEEYSGISDSIRSTREDIGVFIGTIESNFVGVGIDGAEETVASLSEFQEAMKEFEREVTYLIEIFQRNTTPDSVDEIEKIEAACTRFCSVGEQVHSDCTDLVESLKEQGLTDRAESVQTVAETFSGITQSMESSFFDNQLFITVKAHYFPSSVVEEVPEVVDALDAENPDRRLNSYGVLAMVAQEEPDAVAPFATEIASNLSTASADVQPNILTVLMILQEHGETLDRDVRSDALYLANAADPTVALYASLLLAEEATTAEQAQVITTRIESLLTRDIGTEERTNATSVLCKLAQSHPDAVEHIVPNVADLLTTGEPSVQENVIELLAELGAGEYRGKIETVRSNSNTDDVIKAADTALGELPEEVSSSDEDTTQSRPSRNAESIMSDIEDAFEDL